MTTFNYVFYTNETRESRFFEFHKNDVVAKAYEGEVLGQTPTQACNNLFERFNIDHPADYRGRSMSVADVIVLTDGVRQWAFACASLGWSAINELDFVVGERSLV